MRLFDLHCDTITKLFAENQQLFDGNSQVNIKKTECLDRWNQVFAIFIPDTMRGESALEYFLEVSRFYKHQISTNSELLSVKSNHLLSVEGGAVLAGNIDNIEILRENDVKLLTLTWNGENELGFGVSENKGLKDFGRKCIKKLEQAQIVVDVSHLSDAGFYDVACEITKPFVASHSNSRKICNHLRNLTDEQFSYISSVGGIVGVNFHSPFVCEKGDYISSLLAHIEHFLSLGGEKCLCIGSDFDGADIDEELNSIDKISALVDAMRRANYSDDLINDIMFNNARDFFERL